MASYRKRMRIRNGAVEAKKVFNNLQHPTIKGRYVKMHFYKDDITRMSNITG